MSYHDGLHSLPIAGDHFNTAEAALPLLAEQTWFMTVN